MKFNLEKLNLMMFNPTKSEFQPKIKIEDKVLEPVEEIRILGFYLSQNLSWQSNTKLLTSKACKKLWIIRRLKCQGASIDDLIDVYAKQVRSILEYGTPVWNSSLTQQECHDIERVQKVFLHIILGKEYISYETALKQTGLNRLSERREKLCRTFAFKTQKNPKHSHWFVNKTKVVNTRSQQKFKAPSFKRERFRKSPIAYLTNLLNN